MVEAVEFLTDPPLETGQRLGYRLLAAAAIDTIPDRLRSVLGLHASAPRVAAGNTTLGFLRWALGYSPSWQLALIRSGAPIPDGMFTQRAVEV